MEVLCKNTGKWSEETTGRCSVKFLRYALAKILKGKHVDRFFAKLLRNFLKKY